MSTASAPPLVELRGVTFGYGERVILDDISLTVPRGQVTALMGASGGGKTTVLRLIGGQNKAQKGQVLFDGQDVGALDRDGVVNRCEVRNGKPHAPRRLNEFRLLPGVIAAVRAFRAIVGAKF